MEPLPAVSAVGAVRAVAPQGRLAGQPAALPSVAPQPALAETELSDTGRLLQALAQPGAGRADAPMSDAAATLLSRPLLPAPPAPDSASIATLANGLQQSLAESGLFYESHLAAWVGGLGSLPALRSEPQGSLSPLPLPAIATSRAPAQGVAQALPQVVPSRLEAMLPPSASLARPASMLARLAATVLPALGSAGSPAAGATIQHRTAPSPGGLRDTAGPGLAAGVVHPQAAPLVQQQLQALDLQQVSWAVQAWPGQMVHLTAGPEPQPQQDPDSHAHSGTQQGSNVPWRSTLRLTLPGLGAVEARLTLQGQALGVQLAAASEQVDTLRNGLPDLVLALQSSGLQAAQLDVTAGQTPSATPPPR